MVAAMGAAKEEGGEGGGRNGGEGPVVRTKVACKGGWVSEGEGAGARAKAAGDGFGGWEVGGVEWDDCDGSGKDGGGLGGLSHVGCGIGRIWRGGIVEDSGWIKGGGGGDCGVVGKGERISGGEGVGILGG